MKLNRTIKATAGFWLTAMFCVMPGFSVRSQTNFYSAITAVQTINFNGNNVTVDSFDSADPNYSTNGMYSASKRKANGDVVSEATITNSISVGNGNVMGHVRTGPKGTVTVGVSGSVGDVAWVTDGNHGIQNSNYVSHDMNIAFPDLASPNQIYDNPTWYTSFPGFTITIDGITYYQYVTNPGTTFIKLPALTGSIYIGTNANVIIWVTGSCNFSGTNQVTIATGGALSIYSGQSFTHSGGVVFENQSHNAKTFSIRGLTTCTNISLSGGVGFSGTIYAPEANLTIDGGGGNVFELAGSIVARRVTLNSLVQVHFDEDLSRGLPLITSPPQNQYVLIGDPATFNVSAAGNPPPRYQWQRDGADTVGATNSSLSLTNVQLADAGQYRVIITNVFGAVTSAPALLQVYESAAATLTAPSLSASDQFQFTVSGVPGFNYKLEASTNLFNWSPLITNQSPFTFTDPNPADYLQRFYRAVYVP